ncbi:ABC transporter permease [candidate division KSB1 bacterium]
MFLIIKLAFRNVFRNIRRSILTFLTITIGIAISILTVALSIGLERQSIKLSVDTKSGHVKVYGKGYQDDELTLPLDYSFSGYEEIISNINELPSVRSTAEKILFQATLTNGIDELILTGSAINIEREHSSFDLKNRIVKGEYLAQNDEQILIGTKIAELLEVNVGDNLTVIARTKYDALTALDVTIKGLLNTNNPEIDNNWFYIPLSTAQNLLDMDGEITEITAFGSSMNSANALKNDISQVISGNDIDNFEIATWDVVSETLVRIFEIRAKARQIIYLILFIMASASVMNTMLMSIFERTQEIGTLMAMGFKKRKIMYMFSVEGVVLGILGSLTGCMIGGPAAFYLKINGWNITEMRESAFSDFPVGNYIYADITYFGLFIFFLIGVAVALISALYPSWKSSRLEPTDALRSV